MIINCILLAFVFGGMVSGVYSEMTEHQSPLNHQKWLAKKMSHYR